MIIIYLRLLARFMSSQPPAPDSCQETAKGHDPIAVPAVLDHVDTKSMVS